MFKLWKPPNFSIFLSKRGVYLQTFCALYTHGSDILFTHTVRESSSAQKMIIFEALWRLLPVQIGRQTFTLIFDFHKTEMTLTTLFIGRYQNFFFLWVLHVNVLNFVPYSLDRMFQTKKLQRIEFWLIFSFSIFCQKYPVLDSVLYFVCNMYRKYNYIILKRKGKRLKYDMLQMVTYCTSGSTRCWKMTFCRRFNFVKTEMTFTTLFIGRISKFLISMDTSCQCLKLCRLLSR